jgi:nicotinate (nicotinamide) nucleotide adenylyltransferase
MEKKKNRIVVMGGSFNPPTAAHYKLMKRAVDALEADTGFFVPVSDAYLKRKMRHSHLPVVLSPEMRVRMLRSMCSDDSRLQVCEKEIGTIEPRTMPTLQALQEDFPDAELYFVMGADKFDLLASLTKKREFLDAFKVVLFSREDDTLEQTLKSNEVLAHYLERIVILPQPEGTAGVSSSLVRECMLSGESCRDMLCPGVWELFKEFTSKDFPDVINRFKGEYDFLSNRFPCRVLWEGFEYRSAEAAFQASKCQDEMERRVYASCSTDKAIMKGKDQIPYQGWEDDQLGIMESILRAKFELNPSLMQKLVDTGNCILLNGNNKQETFWGIDLYSWIGENHLGKIITNIRDKEISR